MIGWHSQIGATSNQTAGTTLVLTLTAGANVGDLIVVASASDNAGTTSLSTGAAETTVSDSKGNTWQIGSPRAEGRRSAGAVADGVVTALWYTVLTSALVSGDTITLTLTTSRTAKAFLVERYIHESTSGGLSVGNSAAGATGSGTAPTVNITTPSGAPSLVLASLGYEGATADTATNDGNYFRHDKRSSGTNTATSIQANLFSGVVAPSTARNVVNTLSATRDFAQLVIGLREANPPTLASLGYDTSGTTYAGDRLTTDNAVLRFRQYTEVGGLLYTVPDFSLITRSIANGGRATASGGLGIYTVAASNSINRVRARVKIDTIANTPTNNLFGLTLGNATHGQVWFGLYSTGSAIRLGFQYDDLGGYNGFQYVGIEVPASATYDFEARINRTTNDRVDFFYKESSSSTWIAAGSTWDVGFFWDFAAVPGLAPGWTQQLVLTGSFGTIVNGGVLRWEAFTAAAGGPVTLDLTPATITASAVASTPAPGAIAINLGSASTTVTAVAKTPAPGSVALALEVASAASSAIPVSPAPGSTTLGLSPAATSTAAVAVGAAPGAVTVGLGPAVDTVSAVALGAAPGPIAGGVTPAGLAATAVALGAAPGAVTLSLTPGGLAAAAVALGAVPGAVTSSLPPAATVAAAVALGSQPGPVAASLSPATTSTAAMGLGVQPGAVTVGPSPAAIAAAAVAVGAAPGAVTLSLTPAQVVGTAVALQPVAAGQLALAPATVTVTAVAAGVQPGAATASLPPAAAASSAVPLSAAPGAATVGAAPATASVAAVALQPAPGAATVALPPASSLAAAVALQPVPGPITRSLSPAALGAAAVALQPAPGSAALALGAATTTTSARPLTPAPGSTVLALPPATVLEAAVSFTPVAGSVAAALSPAALLLAAVPFGLVRKIKGRWGTAPAPDKGWSSSEPGTKWTTKSGNTGWTTEEE